jgi:hypothetical protein
MASERSSARLQACGDYFSQMRLLIAISNFHCFVQLAFLESAGNAWCEFAGLLASRAEIEGAINDHSQRPDGHDEQNRNNSLGCGSHVVPKVHGGEANGLSGLLKKEHTESCLMGEVSENH